ncbi:MAG: hypothetical protein ACFE95_04965 [Candidatus Hodarchaeota archaeon]
MASIKSVTAGKLLREFIEGYHDEPFGVQGLIIAKQLLDLAVPSQSLKEIISDQDLVSLLSEADAQFKFRKQPFFVALTNFLMEKSLDQLSKMSGAQLKKELESLLEQETSISSIELQRAAYDLSGNPESSYLAKKSLEGALISTTASLFCYLLIEGENQTGKIFRDLERDIRVLANQICTINPLILLLKELITFRWEQVSLIGCLPLLSELDTNDACKYFGKHPDEYINKIKNNYLSRFNDKFKLRLLSLINNCKVKVEKSESDFDLDLVLEFPRVDKIKDKTITDLRKLQSKVKSGKKLAVKDFESIKNNLLKECTKIEQKISKDFQNFQRNIKTLVFQEPRWFKFYKKNSGWDLESSQVVRSQLNEILSIEGAFEGQKLSKTLKQTISIFKRLGGIHFTMENMVAHYFYERVPSRLINIIETPAERQKIEELRFLQEKRYNEGLDAVRKFLIINSEIIISNLMTKGFSLMKDQFIKENPTILIDEENVRNPCYLDLLKIPKDIFDDEPPEKFLGKKYFIFQPNENSVRVGFHIKTLNGRGTDLYSLLVSSASFENAQIYKEATRILGNFSGYVYSIAIGNMRVCPPALKTVNDLFM